MKTKTFNLIFILCLFLMACSTEEVDHTDPAAKEGISNTLNTRAGGPCLLPENPLHVEITYEEGVTLQQRVALREEYRNFAGLHCILQSNTNGVDEIWVVDEDIFNAYCKICEIEGQCCKDDYIEEDDEIEKVNSSK